MSADKTNEPTKAVGPQPDETIQVQSATGDACFDADTLHGWIDALFRTAGSEPDEARLLAEHLVQANLTGHDSHGIGMVPRYVDSLAAGQLQLNQRIEVVSDHGAVLTVDGCRGVGQSVTHQAMLLAIERARTYGVCAMGLRHSHHLGRVGHWAEMAIAAGMISVHFTNATGKPVVAPHGGAQARFVTNPLTIGIARRDAEPLLLDFATSALASGKVRVAYNQGKSVPPGTLIDSAGQPTTDPTTQFVEPIGALLPFAGHKGYALAMACELLGAALTGGDTTRPGNGAGDTPAVYNNMLTFVLDPSKIGPQDRFEAEASAFDAWVRSARLAPGFDRIRMPGDPERESTALRRAEGITVDAVTLAQLDRAADIVNELRANPLRNGQTLGPSGRDGSRGGRGDEDGTSSSGDEGGTGSGDGGRVDASRPGHRATHLSRMPRHGGAMPRR